MSNQGNNKLPETFVIAITTINALLMPISILGNALVLSASLRTPSLRSPSNMFLRSLAFSDLVVGLIVQPVFIAFIHNFKRGSFLFFIGDVMTLSVCSVSMYTMTAISVDRFLALHYHMRYANFMTIKSAGFTSTALWFLGITRSCVILFSEKTSKLIGVIMITLCILTSSFSYLKIYLIVRRHQLQILVQQHAVGNLNAEDNLNMIRSTKSAIATFTYYICMITCYSPAFIFLAIISVFPDRSESFIVWEFLSTTVVYLNSAINPFLYCWRMGELRTAVLIILRKALCYQTAES